MPRPRKQPETETVTEAIETRPVRLLRNYRPDGPFVVHVLDATDGEDLRAPTVAEKLKVWAGMTITLPADEARTMVRKGIAERADAF